MKGLLALALTIFSSTVFAAGGGGGTHSLGVNLVLASPGQDDLNSAIDTINSTQSKSVDKLGTGYEFSGYYQYRFSGTMFALQFRPSIFTQSAGGSGYSTKLTGFTFFPIFRMYPLENTFIHFFMQTGLGYGRLSGSMSGNGSDVSWAGDAFGAMAGLGAEFCFTPAHCAVFEGNFRYLPIQRNVISSMSGTPAGFDSGISNGGELEKNNMDVRTTLSGVSGSIGYQMYF